MINLTLRKLHRWLGLLAGLQLLVWTVSGLYFTLIPIDEIRGNHLLTKEKSDKPTLSQLPVLSPHEIAIRNPDIADTQTSDLSLSVVLGRPIYLIGKMRFDALSGEALPMISLQEALSIVRERVDAAIYVGRRTGRIRAVRTDSWRLFDFLWSLHIMDYEEREDFNHLLIQALAIISLITVISGLILFFTTLRFQSKQKVS